MEGALTAFRRAQLLIFTLAIAHNQFHNLLRLDTPGYSPNGGFRASVPDEEATTLSKDQLRTEMPTTRCCSYRPSRGLSRTSSEHPQPQLIKKVASKSRQGGVAADRDHCSEC